MHLEGREPLHLFGGIHPRKVSERIARVKAT
jgi:hypothetical protein